MATQAPLGSPRKFEAVEAHAPAALMDRMYLVQLALLHIQAHRIPPGLRVPYHPEAKEQIPVHKMTPD